MRKYTLNEQFFDIIDTEQKAYWLGFIAADGHVDETRGVLSVSLAKKDGLHLQKLANALNWNGSLYQQKSSTTIAVCSKQLIKSLVNLGIRQKKSFTLKPWQGSDALLRHYWRGVFDGDGGFCKSTKIRKSGTQYIQWKAILVGTYVIVNAFTNFIRKTTNSTYNNGTISRHSSIWITSYSGLQPTQTIAQHLYHNSEIYLNRKLERAQEVLNTNLQVNKIQIINSDTLLQLYEIHKNWNLVADTLNVSRNGLYKHIRKLNFPRRKWVKS